MKYTYKALLKLCLITLLIPHSSACLNKPISKKRPSTHRLKENLSYNQLIELLKEQQEHNFELECEDEKETSWFDVGVRIACAGLVGYLLYSNRADIAFALCGGAIGYTFTETVPIGPFSCKGKAIALPPSTNNTETVVAQVQVAQQSGLSCGAHAVKNLLIMLEHLKKIDPNLPSDEIKNQLHAALNANDPAITGHNLKEDDLNALLHAGIQRILPEIPLAPLQEGHIPKYLNQRDDEVIIGVEICNKFKANPQNNASPFVQAANYAAACLQPMPIEMGIGTVRGYLINTNNETTESEVNPTHWISCVEINTKTDKKNKTMFIFMDSFLNTPHLESGRNYTVKNFLELHGRQVGDALDNIAGPPPTE